MSVELALKEFVLSDHAKSLNGSDLARYIAKLKLSQCDCPYSFPVSLWKHGNEVYEKIPPICQMDICSYLISQRNELTHEQFEAFRSLHGEQYVDNRWVQHLRGLPLVDGKIILRADVCHSQALSLPPLQPWAVLHKTGAACHCDCVAGLGETCIHISALLYAAVRVVEHTALSKRDVPVTSKPNVWARPYKKPEKLKRISELASLTPRKPRYCVSQIPPPTDEEVQQCYKRLSDETEKPIILSIIPGYSSLFAPPGIPPPLKSLFNKDMKGKSLSVVKEVCEDLLPRISISIEQAAAIEISTRGQSNNPDWYLQRGGRLTSSKCRQFMRMDLNNPSWNFVKEICYPETSKFLKKNEAIRWGLSNESRAVERLKAVCDHDGLHADVKLSETGLVVSTSHPFMASSPDRLWFCSCHGQGVVEVKCPFNHRFAGLSSAAANEKGFPIKVDPHSGDYVMDTDHAYYYQIQHQMCVTHLNFGIFVMYTVPQIVYVLVPRNDKLCDEMKIRSKLFFGEVILPELVSNYFQDSVIKSASSSTPCDPKTNYFPCTCLSEKDDVFVICSGAKCFVKKFHKSCTGSKRFGENWMCQTCKQQRAKDRLAERRAANKDASRKALTALN